MTWWSGMSINSVLTEVDCVWNVMAHAQKPDFVFRWNGHVYFNRRGRQFSRLLAAEVCASAVVMLETACSEVVWRVLRTHSIFLFTLPPMRRVPSYFNWNLQQYIRSFKQCWMLLQAAQCDNYNSVTASHITKKRSCSVPNKPPLLLPTHSPWSWQPNYRPTFRSVIESMMCFKRFAKCCILTSQFTYKWYVNISYGGKNFQHCCWRSITGIL